MKNIKSAIKFIVLSIIFCVSLSSISFADTTSKNLLIEIEESEGRWWKPGDEGTIKFAMKNNTNKKITINKLYMVNLVKNFNTEENKSEDKIEKAYQQVINNTMLNITKGQNTILKEIKMSDFLTTDENITSVKSLDSKITLSPKEIAEFNINLSMAGEEINNDAQNLHMEFDIRAIYTLSSDDKNISLPILPPDDSIIDNPTVIPDDETAVDEELPLLPDTPQDSEIDLPLTPEEIDSGLSAGKLPQTGGFLNNLTVIILGGAVVGLGIVLDRKSSKKGGNSDELDE